MSWKTVFNSDLSNWGHINHAIAAAQKAGYRFLTWNGWIYRIDGTAMNYPSSAML